MMELFLSRPGDAMVPVFRYYPSRRASDGRVRAGLSIGVGSKVCIDGVCWHHLYADIDNKKCLGNILEYAMSRFRDMVWIVRETRKGYHLMVFYPFRRREVDQYIVGLRPCIDRRWLTLQRKRGFYIVRVAGKYGGDIRTRYAHISVRDRLALRYGLFWSILVEEWGKRLEKDNG